MPDWLSNAVAAAPLEPETMAVRLVVAALLGGAVALAYRASHGRLAKESRTLASTLVLLTALLAMVSMVIGESVARAFGLVGALSIVRFRTVVEDTRDTAFVIFAVIVGMAVGTGMMAVAVLGIAVVSVSAIVLSRVRAPAPKGRGGAAREAGGGMTLLVRLGLGRDPSEALGEILTRRTRSHRLVAMVTARQGASIEASYKVSLEPSGAAGLLAELNGVEGVQAVELKSK